MKLFIFNFECCQGRGTTEGKVLDFWKVSNAEFRIKGRNIINVLMKMI